MANLTEVRRWLSNQITVHFQTTVISFLRNQANYEISGKEVQSILSSFTRK
jgi:hypothetical protein